MSKKSLLTEYKLQLFAPKCNPSAEYVNCLAAARQDIREVFPYLNGRLRGCQYNPDAPFLRLRWEGHIVTLRPRQIAVSKLAGREEAEQVLKAIQDLINDTWARREEITPSERRAPSLTTLQLFRLLPGTNCRRCGLPTCLAFAAQLAEEEVSIEQCAPLLEPQHEERRTRLIALLAEAGYDVPEDWL
jgi:ArsR family metal-binding transcriptional regulator